MRLEASLAAAAPSLGVPPGAGVELASDTASNDSSAGSGAGVEPEAVDDLDRDSASCAAGLVSNAARDSGGRLRVTSRLRRPFLPARPESVEPDEGVDRAGMERESWLQRRVAARSSMLVERPGGTDRVDGGQ